MKLCPPPAARRSGSRFGFTLIELLVVISIVMLLALLVAPMYSKFSKGARVETARNIVSSVITQARSLAMKFGRDTMAIGYWRGKGWQGSATPMDNSMTLTIFAQDIGNGAWDASKPNSGGARSPRAVNVSGAPLAGGFLPFQELALPTYEDFLFAPKDPNAASDLGFSDINAASPVFRLPTGMAIAKPVQDTGGATTYYEEFTLIRFRPDGTLSFEPPVETPVNATKATLNDWLSGQWRMQQSGQPGGGGLDQINGDSTIANLDHISAAEEYQKRGFYMALPTDQNRRSAKLPTNVFVVYDYQALVESGINITDRAAMAEWINQNGTLGLINTNTGQVTFSAENERR